MKLIKVNFKSDKLDIIEESKAIVVKDICENLGIAFKPQFEKLKSDESYESKLIKVQTRGGLQEVLTIPLSKLDGWLFSINPNKVKPEVKQKLIEYKKECFNVLNNYFNQGIAINHRASDTDLQKILETLEKQNQEIQNLKNQLALQEEVNPFKGFYDNFKPRKRENEFAYSRKDWMLLLSECERVLVQERQSKRQLLLTRGAK